jgi:hypothetical protein
MTSQVAAGMEDCWIVFLSVFSLALWNARKDPICGVCDVRYNLISKQSMESRMTMKLQVNEVIYIVLAKLLLHDGLT